MKKIYISQLSEHLAEEISEDFYLKNVSLKYTKDSGIPYLYLKLQDKTGSIQGRIWENNIDDQYLALKGKMVKVHGEVLKSSSGTLEFVCWKMEPLTEYDINSFVNGLNEIETQKYLKALDKQILLVKHDIFKELLDLVFTGTRTSLAEAPASLYDVGSYNGGLLVQTVSVTSIAIQIMRSQTIYAYHPALKISYQEDLLITGALLFGIGTIHLYSPFPEAEKIGEFALLPKETLSIQIIEDYSRQMKQYLSVEDKNQLYHIIQNAYKGEKHKAMNREALIVSMAYALYLRISKIEYYLTENQQKSGAVYIPQLSNYLYFPKRETDGGSNNEPT